MVISTAARRPLTFLFLTALEKSLRWGSANQPTISRFLIVLNYSWNHAMHFFGLLMPSPYLKSVASGKSLSSPARALVTSKSTPSLFQGHRIITTNLHNMKNRAEPQDSSFSRLAKKRNVNPFATAQQIMTLQLLNKHPKIIHRSFQASSKPEFRSPIILF